MKKQANLLNKKRKTKSICKGIEKNQEANKAEDWFLQQTFSFLNNIKNKIFEIDQIRSGHIEGILTNYTKMEINKKTINDLDDKKEDSEESDCCIVYEENYDKKKYNYNHHQLKIETFDSYKDCLICFKKINETFNFSCGHKVCNRCGSKWIRIKRACPICRESI